LTQAITDNVAGHRVRYEHLIKHMPLAEAKNVFVGGGDSIVTGFIELEITRTVRSLKGADVVDVGCGIGRLTQHLINEPISSYLGLDVVEEVLDEARKIAARDERFNFAIPEHCKIPKEDKSADIVVGFSLITHLLNEEVLRYFQEARRVLRSGGTAIFSFMDLANENHRALFVDYAARSSIGDLMVFTTRETLNILGECAGFKNLTFVDGTSEPFTSSGVVSPLMPREQIPKTIALGQSICFLRI
jgi:SAM-dependent methyltransferase